MTTPLNGIISSPRALSSDGLISETERPRYARHSCMRKSSATRRKSSRAGPSTTRVLVPLPAWVVGHKHAPGAPLALFSLRRLHFENAAQHDDELAIRRNMTVLI